MATYLWLGLVAIFLGIAAAILPPVLLMGLITIPIVIFLVVGFPVFAFAAVFVLMFGLLPPFLFASLPLGNATLRPPELLLLLLFIALSFRSFGSWRVIYAPLRPIAVPLALLAIGLLIGILKGSVIANNPRAWAEARLYVAWLALPLALWVLRNRSEYLHRVMMIIAIIASLAMVFQLISGIQVIYGFRGAEELSRAFSDVKRSSIGGGTLFLCYAAYFLFGSYLQDTKRRSLAMFGLIVLIGGIAATFSRAVWAGFMVGGLVFLLITPSFKKNKSALIVLLLALCSITAVAIVGLSPRVGDAIADRIIGVTQEGARGTSIGFRLDENDQAFNAIQRSPVLGIGLGGEYKRAFRQSEIGGGFDIETSFIHNGYLALWLKFGIAGLLFPFALAICIYRLVRKIPTNIGERTDTNTIGAYAAAGALAMMYVESLTSPNWSQQGHIAATAVLLVVLLGATQPSAAATISSTGIKE